MNVQDWLTQARDRADAATEGPWHNTMRPGASSGMFRVLPEGYEHFGADEVGKVYTLDDAAFIADARTRLPAALDAIQAVLDLVKHGKANETRMLGFGDWPLIDARSVEDAIATALGVSEP